MGIDDTRVKAAAEWLVELKTSNDIEALWPAFLAWLQAAPENHPTYLQLEEVWRISERAMAPIERCRSDTAARFAEEVRSASAKRLRQKGLAVVMGVSFAAVVITGLWLALWMRTLPYYSAWNRYDTAYGERRPIQLSDGSRIDLNTNSCVWVRITRDTREVSLERGEAFFTVARDSTHPFKVSVSRDVLTAISTQFSVLREPSGLIQTVVLGGWVAVGNRDGSEGSGKHVSLPLRLAKAGSAVVITATNTTISDIGLLAVKRRLAWLNGNIVVDGKLADAVEEFNRYNRRQLEVANSAYADRHIHGIFKATDPDTFARAVQNDLKIPVVSTGSALKKTGTIRLGALQ